MSSEPDWRDIVKPTGSHCTNCGREHLDNYWHNTGKRTWWTLSGYYGIWGYFCPECHDKVEHDSYGNPRFPEDYRAVAVKQQIVRANRN